MSLQGVGLNARGAECKTDAESTVIAASALVNIHIEAGHERCPALADCAMRARLLPASVISHVPQIHFSTTGRYTFFHGSSAMSRSVTSGGTPTTALYFVK